eukprot:scaffold15925_cov54-Phaeocystis_antarctica.AAC.4
MVLEIKVAPSCNATLVTLFHPLPPRGKIRQKSYSGWSHVAQATWWRISTGRRKYSGGGGRRPWGLVGRAVWCRQGALLCRRR